MKKYSSSNHELALFLKTVEKILDEQLLETEPATSFKSEFYKGEAPTLAIVLGIPSSEHLFYIRSQFPASTILFWLYPPSNSEENDKNFLQAGEKTPHTIICPLNSNTFFIEKIALLIQEMPERRIRLISLNGLRDKFPKEYSAIQQTITAQLTNAEQERNRGLVRLRCSIRNLPSIVKNRNIKIKNVNGKTPVVICGAGPSLINNFGLLKEVSHKINIFAVGHAVKPLLAHDIIPDLVVEVDSHAFRNWENTKKLPSLLAACPELAPYIVNYFENILWCYGSSPSFNSLLEKWGIELFEVSLQKTVTVPAISLAIKMGFKNIALLGQDFAIGNNNIIHADGSTLPSGDSLCELPALNGGTVRSTRGLATLRESLQDYLACLKQQFANNISKPEIINCSMGGAKIEGTPHLEFMDFLTRYATAQKKKESLYERGKEEKYGLKTVEACEAGLKNSIKALSSQSIPHGSSIGINKHTCFIQKLLKEDDNLKPLARLTLQKVLEASLYLKGNMQPCKIAFDPYRFTSEILDDLLSDLQQSLSELREASGREEEAILAPYSFKAFRNYAIARVIEGGNTEFAEWLQKERKKVPPESFDCRLMNQIVPFITFKLAPAKFIPLSGFENMMELARARVEDFAVKTTFNVDDCFVVFPAPANWIYTIELFRKYPATNGCILEIFPELFNYIIDFGLFLNQVKAGTPIIACSEVFKEWTSIFKKIIQEQVLQKKRIIIFHHPECSLLPEVQNFHTTIEKMIKGVYEQ
jgi:hypothetical protein